MYTGAGSLLFDLSNFIDVLSGNGYINGLYGSFLRLGTLLLANAAQKRVAGCTKPDSSFFHFFDEDH